MQQAERAVKGIDRFQQVHLVTAFTIGVIRKFGDDRSGSLAALIAYYTFLSLFPLLLLLFTVLGLIAGSDPRLVEDLKHSVLSQFPVIGSTLGANVTALHAHSVVGLVVGVVGLLWGSQGAMNAAQYAMAEIWEVPEVARPNYWSRLLRTYGMVAVLGSFLILSTAAATLTRAFHLTGPARVGTIAVALLVNVSFFVVAYRVLTPKNVEAGSVVPGAAVGGIGWTVLQYLGTLYIGHALSHTKPVYGFFGVVLGLLAWIYLGAELFLFAAEVNVVRTKHLWPRSLVQPPFTDADQRALRALTAKGVRREEQRVEIGFDDTHSEDTG
jgi:YihY family inner membrane protein